jgi:hypothetical protein
MHAGLAQLAEGEATGRISSLIARVKGLVSNREAVKLAAGKQLILARTFFSPAQFSKPENRDIWLQRVRANFGHYRSLYSILFVVVAVYTGACSVHLATHLHSQSTCAFFSSATVLSSPLLLFGLTVLAGAWAYAFVLTSPETPISIAGFELRRRAALTSPHTTAPPSPRRTHRAAPHTSLLGVVAVGRREKLFALAPFSILVVTLCGLINSLIYVIFLTVFLALPHASFHEVAEVSLAPRRQPAHAARELTQCARAAARPHHTRLCRCAARCSCATVCVATVCVAQLDALDTLELEGLQSGMPSV